MADTGLGIAGELTDGKLVLTGEKGGEFGKGVKKELGRDALEENDAEAGKRGGVGGKSGPVRRRKLKGVRRLRRPFGEPICEENIS